jgi:hypothetical protein
MAFWRIEQPGFSGKTVLDAGMEISYPFEVRRDLIAGKYAGKIMLNLSLMIEYSIFEGKSIRNQRRYGSRTRKSISGLPLTAG